ncbi:MAG: hypothetical protein ABI995_12320, partial [Acidobacteriota bacterium]
ATSPALPNDFADPRLVLVEERSVTLPESYEADGAAIGAHDRIVAWSRRIPGIMLSERSAFKSLCGASIREPVAAAFVRGTSTIEVVDRASLSLWQISAGQCRRAAKIAGVTDLQGGDLGDAGWLIGIVDSSGRAGIALVKPGDSSPHNSKVVVYSDGRVSDPTSLLRGHLRTRQRTAVAVSLRWPFQLVRMTIGGTTSANSVTRRDLGTLLNEQLGKGHSISDWLALAIVPLDNGYLQTFADPRSDQRLLVRYSDDGSIKKIESVNVPIGAVYSLREERRLLFFRQTNRLELVVYRWHWGA